MNSLRIEERPVKDLRPAPYNPRKIGKAALAALEKSMERFGIVQPIIVNERTGFVVGGHQRLAVLRKKKIAKTQVAIVNLSESEEKALNLALNNPHASGFFDDSQLETILSQISDQPFFTELRLEPLGVTFEDAPDSTRDNVEKMREIKEQRKRGNEAVVDKNDTERYLVIVYPTRAARENAMTMLGLPKDERYVDAASVIIELQSSARSRPEARVAPKRRAGANG